MSLNHLPEQEQIRRNSLEEIRKLGIDPYPAEGYEINTSSKEILENYDPDKENFQDVSLAGRIMSRRIMGNASFIEIQDSAGKIQVYFRRDTICPDEDKTQYNTLFKKLLDIGDIIGVMLTNLHFLVNQSAPYLLSKKRKIKLMMHLPILSNVTGTALWTWW